MIFNKTRKYFQEKVRIDKRANKSTAYKVQVYNNAKIDELVKRMNSGETGAKPSSAMVSAELSILNKPDIYKNYNRIINSKYTSNEAMDKMLVKNKANKDLERIVKNETERIIKNLNYVEKVMQKYNIPQQYYEDFRKNQAKNSVANRQQLLKDVAVKAGEINASEGFNIPTSYNYRNLEASAENMLRQSQMQSKHEEINAINENYLSEGKDEIYTGKEWIWTGAGNTTRHASNDHQKREVNEPFIIVNDETLEIDELMYPSDPAGSYGNTFICYCEIEYLTDYGEATPIDLSSFEPVDNPILSGDTNVSSLSMNPLMFMEKPKGEFIDRNSIKDYLFEEEGRNGQYWLNENTGAYKNEAGNWEYKGLEADDVGSNNSFGKWNVESVERHNYEVKGAEPNVESDIKTQLKLEEPAEQKASEEIVEEPKKEFDQERFDELRTHEEVAEFFGLEYKGKTIRFDTINGEAMDFFDPKHECTIRIFVDKANKPPSLDLTNSGKANVNLKDFIKAYEDAPINLKRASGEINVMKGDKYGAGGDCGDHKITIYEPSFADHHKQMDFWRTGEVYGEMNTMETNLWHEMTHAFEHLFLKEGEFNRMDGLAGDVEARWKEATQKDYDYQRKNGIEIQDSTSYGEEKINEDFAEFGGAVASKLVGKSVKFVQWNAYSTKTSAGRRKMFISETLKNNPNRAKLMEELLTDTKQVSNRRKIEDMKRLQKIYEESDMVHFL